MGFNGGVEDLTWVHQRALTKALGAGQVLQKAVKISGIQKSEDMATKTQRISTFEWAAIAFDKAFLVHPAAIGRAQILDDELSCWRVFFHACMLF